MPPLTAPILGNIQKQRHQAALETWPTVLGHVRAIADVVRKSADYSDNLEIS